MDKFYQLSPGQQADLLQDVACKALQAWALPPECVVTLLKYRENAVFKVEALDGTKYALRVHRHGYHSDAAIRSELQWMEALNDRGILTPKAVPTIDGELFELVSTDAVLTPHQCDLISWVDGQELGSVENGVGGDSVELIATYRKLGELAARLHTESNEWELPADFSRHAWDEEGLLGDDPLWGRFWELELLTEEEKNIVVKARDKARKELLAFGKAPDRYGLIHADFLPENLFQSSDGISLIDFDDAGYGWHLFEFATSLLFQFGEPHFEAVSNAMIEGYRSVRPLSDEQVALLPTFFLIRGLVYLGWIHTRAETEIAQTLGPQMVPLITGLAREYLQSDRG